MNIKRGAAKKNGSADKNSALPFMNFMVTTDPAAMESKLFLI